MERFFKNNKYIPLLALICAFGWSMAYPLIKVGYDIFGIASADIGGKILFSGLRFFFAGLIVLLFCRIRKTKTEIRERKDISWLLLLALVNTALHYMFAYIGLGFNTSARSTILDSMGGFFLIILSVIIFPDDRFTASKLIGCLLGIAGIVSINIGPGADMFENITFMGDGMILLNAVCAGFGGVITRVVSKKMNMMFATGMSMLIGGVLMLITGALIGTDRGWSLTPAGIAVLLALIMISAVCFAIYNELIAYHPISRITIYNALIPVLGVIFAALLLHEELKWQYLISVILVALGIYIVNRKPRSEKKSKES